jgi:hypothetical protein
MHRSAFSPCTALGIALALTLSAPSNPQRDNGSSTEFGAEVSSPAEQPRGESGMLDMASPQSDPVPPDDGTQKDEGSFDPD